MQTLKTKKIKGRSLPGSVALLIDKSVPIFRMKNIVQDVIQTVLDNSRRYDSLNYLYVVDDKLRLLGIFSIKELLRGPKNKQVKHIMNRKVITATYDMNEEEVALLALRHNLKSIPIVDSHNHLVGAYDSDELLELLDRKISKSYLKFSGVSPFHKELVADISAYDLARARLPWIITGILGGTISAILMNIFRPALDSAILLILLLPLVLGLGANVANQSAMIFIRNLLSTDIGSAMKYIVKEIKTSLVMAFILSSIVGLLSFFILGSTMFVIIAVVSSILIVISSSVIGVAVPFILNYLKFDPATGSGPFLTIIKDIVVILIYFSVATILLAFF